MQGLGLNRGVLGRALAFAILLFQINSARAVAEWQPTGALNTARSGHRAILLPGGQVLVIGGSGPNGNFLASCEVYDPGTGAWTEKAPMAQARSGFSATVLSDGRILVAGGQAGEQLKSTEIYDPMLDTWTPAPSMTRSRVFHSATRLQNGWVLVAGGLSDQSNQASATAEIYKPTPNGWTLTGALNQGRNRHTAFLVPDGSVVVVGGSSVAGGGPASRLDSVEIFRLGTGSWSVAEAMTGGRSAHTSTRLQDGRILVVGGGDNLAQTFDTSRGNWTLTGQMANPRSQHATALLSDGRVLVTGGTHQFQPLESVELFDPLLGLWSSVEGLGSPRSFHTATTLLNGTVLVAGGSDGSAAVADSLVFEPGGPILPDLLVYPQLALGGGFQIIFSITNRTPAPWQGSAQLDGGAWPAERNWTLNGSDRTGEGAFPISLSPFGSRTFVLGSEEGPFSGWLEVTAEAPSQVSDLATAFFYNFFVEGRLDDSTGVPAAPPAAVAWFPVERSTFVNTGMAIRRTTLPLTFRLYDQEGELVDEVTREFQGASFFDTIFSGVGDEFRGAVRIESGVGFYMTVLRQELLPGAPLRFQLTSVPPTLGR